MAFALLLCFSTSAYAQPLASCNGHDERGAGQAFARGNELMQQAATEARARHRDRARELATQALSEFDRQCELGDPSALAERGGALILLGEALRSAQSYDAYLALHPLETLDARTRRRVEPNLQPGIVSVALTGRSDARLFVDGLDFGVVRSASIRLPLGGHDLEAREDAAVVATTHVVLEADRPATWSIEGHPDAVVAAVIEDDDDTDASPLRPAPPATARVDYLGWELVTGITLAAALGAGIGLQLASVAHEDAYAATCSIGPATGCDATLAERDGLLDGAIAAYVVAGVALVGLLTVIAIDLGQPSSGPTAIACGVGPMSWACEGEF